MLYCLWRDSDSDKAPLVRLIETKLSHSHDLGASMASDSEIHYTIFCFVLGFACLFVLVMGI